MAKWINLFEKKARPEPAAQNGEVQSSPLPGGMISSHARVAESAPDQPPTAAEQAETEAAQIIENARQGAEEIRKRVTDTLKNVIDRAVADAEQASATIKIKAKAEAEEEAGRIIQEARQKAEEMIRAGTPREPLRQPAKATIVEAEPGVKIITGKVEEKKQPSQFSAMSGKLSGILTMKIGKKPGDADKPAELSDKPVKASAENRPPRESMLSGLLNMKLGKNNKKESAVPAEPVAETALPAKETEASLSQPAAAPPVIEKPKVIEAKAPAAEQPIPAGEPRPSQQPGKAPESEPDPAALQKLDINAAYEGEVELSIAVPIDPVAVSKLYSYLQTTPDMKILYTRGSWEKGTVITVSLDKPLPFFGMISKIQGIKITPGAYQKETAIKGTSSSLLGAKRSGVTRINIRLKSE